MMYVIILMLNGKYHCEFRLQDGTERYIENTLEDAIKHAKTFARVMNGEKIKKKDIDFFREKPVTKRKLVPWKP